MEFVVLLTTGLPVIWLLENNLLSTMANKNKSMKRCRSLLVMFRHSEIKVSCHMCFGIRFVKYGSSLDNPYQDQAEWCAQASHVQIRRLRSLKTRHCRHTPLWLKMDSASPLKTEQLCVIRGTYGLKKIRKAVIFGLDAKFYWCAAVIGNMDLIGK